MCVLHVQLSHDVGRQGSVALTLRRLGRGAAEASLTLRTRLWQQGQDDARSAADAPPPGAYACTLGWDAEEGPTLEVDARAGPFALTLHARRACCFAELASGCFAAEH